MTGLRENVVATYLTGLTHQRALLMMQTRFTVDDPAVITAWRAAVF